MEAKTSVNNSGMFGSILFIVFLVLKLTGNIDWKWIWVFSPIWMAFVFVSFCMVVVFIVGIIIEGKEI